MTFASVVKFMKSVYAASVGKASTVCEVVDASSVRGVESAREEEYHSSGKGELCLKRKGNERRILPMIRRDEGDTENM